METQNLRTTACPFIVNIRECGGESKFLKFLSGSSQQVFMPLQKSNFVRKNCDFSIIFPQLIGIKEKIHYCILESYGFMNLELFSRINKLLSHMPFPPEKKLGGLFLDVLVR